MSYIYLFYYIGDIIPPNANLIFETELVQVADGPKVPNVFKMIDINSDSHLSIDEVSVLLSYICTAKPDYNAPYLFFLSSCKAPQSISFTSQIQAMTSFENAK